MYNFCKDSWTDEQVLSFANALVNNQKKELNVKNDT
jgi:hypothetical protein